MYNLLLSYMITYNLGRNSSSSCLRSADFTNATHNDYDNLTGDWYGLCSTNNMPEHSYIRNDYVLRRILDEDKVLIKRACAVPYDFNDILYLLQMKGIPGYYFMISLEGFIILPLNCLQIAFYKIMVFKQHAIMYISMDNSTFTPSHIKGQKDTCYIHQDAINNNGAEHKYDIYHLCGNDKNKKQSLAIDQKCLKLDFNSSQKISAESRLLGDWYALTPAKFNSKKKPPHSSTLKFTMITHQPGLCNTIDLNMDELITSFYDSYSGITFVIGKQQNIYQLIVHKPTQYLDQCTVGPPVEFRKYNNRFIAMSVQNNHPVDQLVMIKVSKKLNSPCVVRNNAKDLFHTYQFVTPGPFKWLLHSMIDTQ